MEARWDAHRPHLFDGVRSEDRVTLDARLDRRRFLPGETLLVQEQPPSCIYLVESGSAEVSRLGIRGDKQVFGHLEAGAACGEMSLSPGIRSAQRSLLSPRSARRS